MTNLTLHELEEHVVAQTFGLATLSKLAPLFSRRVKTAGEEDLRATFPVIDCSSSAEQQDGEMVAMVAAKSRRSTSSTLFAYGSVDLMTARVGNKLLVFLMEINGANVGFWSSLPPDARLEVLRAIYEGICNSLKHRVPNLIVYGYNSGPDLLLEKLQVAQYIHGRLAIDFGDDFEMLTPEAMAQGKLPQVRKTLLVGPFMDLAPMMTRVGDSVFINGKKVDLVVNELGLPAIGRLRPDIVPIRHGRNGQRYHGSREPPFTTVNHWRVAEITSQKHRQYELVRDNAGELAEFGIKPFWFKKASDPEEALKALEEPRMRDKGKVIKAYGSSQGKGIAFVPAGVSRVELKRALARCMESYAGKYGTREGVFPVTICELVDGDTIRLPDGSQHVYDLRFHVVVRNGAIYAYPTIIRYAEGAKVPGVTGDNALKTNISGTAQTGRILPLASQSTMSVTRLTADDLVRIARGATKIIERAIQASSGRGGK